MLEKQISRIVLVVFIFFSTFSIYFFDGYFQWVNSDTAGEACAISQEIRFPQAIFAEKNFHSRITGHVLSYVPFNVVGRVYSELFNDPVNSLYVAQGVMTGLVYSFLVMISAAYVSSAASVTSLSYLVSATLVMFFAMSLTPVLHLNATVGVTIRFSHQAVMTNYVGTLVIALFALFPFWRYMCTGLWDDIYESTIKRPMMYFCFFAAAFSSTCTAIWLIFISMTALLLLIYKQIKKSEISSFYLCFKQLSQISLVKSVFLLLTLCSISVAADVVTRRGGVVFNDFDVTNYIKTFFDFIYVGGNNFLYFLLLVLVFALLFHLNIMRKNDLQQRGDVLSFLPWLLICNVAYVFFIGMPAAPYRFGGFNLGRDTVLPATWTTSMVFFMLMINCWKFKKMTWLAPVLAFMLFTNSMKFFSLPYYGHRIVQKRIFDDLYRKNSELPPNDILQLSWRRVSFSAHECEIYTIPMLRRAGIVSYDREVEVVD